MKVVIGLGTNIGDRLDNLKTAISLLTPKLINPSIQSSIYETSPWGVINQPMFLNMVIIGETNYSPSYLISEFKKIEKFMGRKPNTRHGPRLIDIDLVAYGEEVYRKNGIIVPQIKLEEREFVLIPFKELWPSWRHPEFKLSVNEMLENLSKIRPLSSKLVVTRQQNRVSL